MGSIWGLLPRSSIWLDDLSLFLVTLDISPELIFCDTGKVNWLVVLGHIYGRSNFGHNFCQLTLPLQEHCLSATAPRKLHRSGQPLQSHFRWWECLCSRALGSCWDLEPTPPPTNTCWHCLHICSHSWVSLGRWLDSGHTGTLLWTWPRHLRPPSGDPLWSSVQQWSCRGDRSCTPMFPSSRHLVIILFSNNKWQYMSAQCSTGCPVCLDLNQGAVNPVFWGVFLVF